MTRRPSVVLTLCAALVALVIAGCGGDDDDSSSGNGDEAPEETTATNEELVAEVAGVTPEDVTCSAVTSTDSAETTETTTATTEETDTEETEEGDSGEGEDGEAESCQAGEAEYVVGGPGVEVPLDTLTARLDSVETLTEVVDPFGEDPRTPKNGIYVQAGLTVSNTDIFDQKFSDFSDQTQMNVGATAYKENFNAVLNLDDSFAFQDEQIPPDSSQTGVVLYDVPETVVDQVADPGVAIAVVNWEDTGSIRRATQIGLLRIDELEAPEETETETEPETEGETTTETTTEDEGPGF